MSSSSKKLNINTPKYVIFGSGVGFEFINDRFNILDGADFFIESTPSTREKYGKRVLSVDEFTNMNYSAEDYTILICNRFWKRIKDEDEYKKLGNYTVIDVLNTMMSDVLNENIEMKQYYPQMIKFIGVYRDIEINPCDEKEKLLIMIQEWVGMVIPFQQIALGMMLRAKGVNVEFLLNDQSYFGDAFLHDGVNEYQNKLFIELLEKVKDVSGIPFYKLSESNQIELDKQELQILQRKLYYNKVWLTRSIVLNDNSELLRQVEYKWYKNARAIKGFLSTHDYHKVVTFTGIHFEFSILNELAKLFGKQVYTYEYVRGYTFSKSGPAVLQKDIRFMEDKELSHSQLSYFYEFADTHMKNNFKGKTNKSIQKSVLIPLNIFWDSAAFGDHDVFGYFDEWLVKTIEYILANHSVKVIVRQHPHERRFGTGKEVESLLRSKFDGHPLFEFIPASSDVDSYELIENASVILPNTSTVGVEAALIGKNVIVKNDVYYANAGFVKKAESEKEYFQYISEALQEQEIKLTDDKILKAKLYFALIMHNSVDNSFGHVTSDFMMWIEESWDTLMNHRSTKWLLDMIINNKTLLENYMDERPSYENWDTPQTLLL
ncbi:hypothetical protein B1748_18500 [Paenibacillus sp. MY03]|uniref:capsular polysaccharide export protein, LipB/KpsS family n=1 Tax=Paenibacillus sp. MY03 TaxID=302980 RepID=UPI000B3BE3E9|nr:hypothetical protein [Paenibacillus sp. MY03]OUS75130.1 hypothetical protein B1748_18500 [Paenibacillus sp. MY03]